MGQWLLDFCNFWGNPASVASLVITLIGFGLIIWNQTKLQRGIRQAVEKVAHQLLSADLEDLARLIAALRDSAREGH